MLFHSSQGFAEFVFRWYVAQGKRGKLMTSSLASHPQLSSFLQNNDNKFMSWIHDIQAGDYFRVRVLKFCVPPDPSTIV